MDSWGVKNSLSSTKNTKKNRLYTGYNIRIMISAEKLEDFEKELKYIKCDLVALCETRLANEANTVTVLRLYSFKTTRKPTPTCYLKSNLNGCNFNYLILISDPGVFLIVVLISRLL